MIKINDGTQTKRVAGKPGDRVPQTGIVRPRAVYVAVGGETSINLASLSPAISYVPGNAQITVKRSSGGNLISALDFFETSASTISFPTSDPLLAGEWVEVIKEVTITGVMAATPRPDLYSATGVVGQTLITADFSWSYALNPTKSQGGVAVYLHGILQTRGIDYNEVNLGTANTNQITFVDALLGGENIILIPTYQVIDQSAATSVFQGVQMAGVQAGLASGFQGFVDTTSTIAVPNTTIVNRAKIVDISNDLKTSFGVERMVCQVAQLLQNEFGPNGEQVFSVLNDDRGLVRLVGNWSSANDAAGVRINSSPTITDYAEITFYGTSLNLLTIYNTANDIRVTVDGGAESANVFAGVSGSAVITSRNYMTNVVVNVASGLALGLHTVKLRNGSASAGFAVGGFEILNANASGLVNSNPGTAYLNGLKAVLSANSTFNYTSGVTGTKGGRQLVYLTSAGTIGNAFTPTNVTAQLYGSVTNHTNETMNRSYSPREFGAGRSDDFSTLAGSSSVAFTLDDGTTTLSGASVQIGKTGTSLEGVMMVVNGSNVNFTFVGTGLDVVYGTDTTGGNDNYTVTIDNGTPLSLPTAGIAGTSTLKIASGLPYGTHNVHFTRISAATFNYVLCKFLVYGPSKPSLPAGAVELADFNVMANFVANSTSSSLSISQGAIRKSGLREFAYTGTWTVGGFDGSEYNGFNFFSNVAGSTASYTFFGTGIEFRFVAATSGTTGTVSIDGSTNVSAYTTSFYGISTFTPSTGSFSQNAGSNIYGSGISISGLPLGLHTFKVTNVGGNAIQLDCFDVITPIHSPRTVGPADVQNTLTTAAAGISDNRRTTPVKDLLPAAKAWSQALGVTSSPSTTSTTDVPVPDMSCTIKTNGGPLQISYSISTSINAISTSAYRIYLNGIAVGTSKNASTDTANFPKTISDQLIIPVAAGVHKVDLYWQTGGGTLLASTDRRTLTVREF